MIKLSDNFIKSNDVNRSSAMDGVRGLAVLIVFLSHPSGRDQALSPMLQFHGIGQVGVYLFFVLSGYLLASNLIDEWNKTGSISIKNFLIRRFFRIAPLYYFVLASVFLYQLSTNITYPSYLHIDDGVLGFIKHLLFFKGDGVFWTIPTEFIFYLVLPWLVIFGLEKGMLAYYILATVAILYFLWFLLITVNLVPSAWALKLVQIKHSSQFLDVFICGVLAAFTQKNALIIQFFKENTWLVDRIATFVLVTTLLLTFAMISFKFLNLDRLFYSLRWASLLYGLVFAFVIMTVSLNGIICKIFEIKVLRFLGVVGFSWYLIHLLVLQIVNSFSFAPPIKFLLSTLLLVVFTSFLYTFVEKPFMRVGKKLTTR